MKLQIHKQQMGNEFRLFCMAQIQQLLIMLMTIIKYL